MDGADCVGKSRSRIEWVISVPSAELGLYFGVVLASLAIAFAVLNLGTANLRVPFAYSGDALYGSALIKSGLTNGSFFVNGNLGAPGGENLLDFPSADGVSYLILRALGLFTQSWALTMNLFYVMGFPLAAATALYVFRRFQLDRWLAGHAPAC